MKKIRWNRVFVIVGSVSFILLVVWFTWYMQPEKRFLRYVNRMWRRDGMPREMRRRTLYEINVQEWMEHQEAEDEQADTK